MPYSFKIDSAALKRNFAVYVVVARGKRLTQLYVGKTGDNREGCNPLISRCGNHFSYNKLHNQVRSKIEAHGTWQYSYVFDHFDEYCEHRKRRRARIDRINELERWLNTEIQNAFEECAGVKIVNPFLSRGWVNRKERERRKNFHTPATRKKVEAIVDHVKSIVGIH
jgi:hypothetical protein